MAGTDNGLRPEDGMGIFHAMAFPDDPRYRLDDPAPTRTFGATLPQVGGNITEVLLPHGTLSLPQGPMRAAAVSAKNASARAYDGLCRLPDGSIHPYTKAGGGYVNIYDGGNLNTNGQAGIGQATNVPTMPTETKRGGLAGGGRSGPVTSPASRMARKVTGSARLGGSSVGRLINNAIRVPGSALMFLDFLSHYNAPICEPVYDPTEIY